MLLTVVASATGAGAEKTPAEEIVCEITSMAGVNTDISNIPAAQRELVIAKLREIATKKGSVKIGTTLVHPMSADLVLLRLGDQFTIERMIEDYRAYDSRTSWSYVTAEFESSRQPRLIPYLAEDFYSKEDPTKGITITPPPDSGEFAVGAPARSIFSGVIVTRIIKKAPEFSPQMKAWAHQAFALRLETPERFRNLMRVWWEANKAAFAREDYQAVIPVAEEAAEVAAPASTPTQSTPAPRVISSATPKATPGEIRAPVKRTVTLWPWVVGISALSLVAALAWKRRE
ncbi:MAG: hypothetical protein M3463_14010 [Verrucomicrobiota bacterium]|nr:hypothetical protein [Verrucomicrobiota bacterium]